MRIIIAGGRDFIDVDLLWSTMDALLEGVQDVTIVSGGARGADKMGERYADSKNLPVQRYPADWNKYGKQAGYLRNAEMAANADALVAFWDKKSNGTRHMIDLAKKAGLTITVINY